MPTQCITDKVQFQALGRRRLEADFSGGSISSDAGALLLREVESRRGIIRRFSSCFTDHRDSSRIEHSVEHLVKQRVYGIALGYEDVCDHDRLRIDPLWGALVGKSDPNGLDRKRERDRGCALAGKSTLNRLERTPRTETTRYHKITHDEEAIADTFVDIFLDAHSKAKKRIILDLDATDDVIHGKQEGRFFHGYYNCYCYLPLYIFAGRHLLCSKLRRSNIDGAAGSLEEVRRIVTQIRDRWPKARFTLRGDSGFARDDLMSWCESAPGVDYIFGLAKNDRLMPAIEKPLERVREKAVRLAMAVRSFKEMRYRTKDSWSRRRRVVAKAEYLPLGSHPKANPRFVVTSLSKNEFRARELYEELYCARGEMENRIKEQQLDLFADRTSTATMRANQLRLWLSSMAYVMIEELRRLGLQGTCLAKARAMTIRLKLFKIGALIRVSVRRVAVHMTSAHPEAELFIQVARRLERAPPLLL